MNTTTVPGPRLRGVLPILLLAIALVASLLAMAPAAAVQVPMDGVVSDDPANHTPHALNGRVYAILPIGDLVVVGGTFTRIQNQGSATEIAQPYLFAFNRVTGVISETFRPQLDGDVEALAAAADGRSVYVGGAFNQIDGQFNRRLARIDLATGQADPTFNPIPDARVRDIKLAGDRVFFGGLFSSVNGQPQAAFAAVDATTGALDPDVALTFSGPRGGSLNVSKLDVTPDLTQVVVIGNFSQVDGQPRGQLAIIDVAGGPARLSDWRTDRYDVVCSTSFNTYMRDVDIAPDGSYMVIVTTGAYRANTLCDTAARWELGGNGSGQQPTWVNYTGGDTLYSAGITGDVVYIGGHQRWVNNSFAADRVGPGAVPREGIAALDPTNGLPFTWDPGRTRGVGLFDIVSTPDELYVTSDTDRIGNFEYHGRLAMFPLAGGYQVPVADPGPLPGTLFTGSGSSLVGRPFDGTAVGSASPVPGVSWGNVRAAMMLSGQLYTANADGTLRQQSFDGTTLGQPTTVDLRGLGSRFPVSDLTGMTYDALTGRMYYTVRNSSALHYRYFTAESGVVGADTFTASGNITGLDWRDVRGLHLHGTTLYLSTANGQLRRVTLNGGSPVAASLAQVSTPGVSWNGSGLFVYSPAGYDAPNLPPAARITVSCGDTDCHLGSTGSADPDGRIASFAWDLGDGTSATGPGVQHTFGDGTFEVTLTVTDDEGATATTTQVVEVQLPPVADIEVSCVNLSCAFDGSASTDGGTIVEHAWDLGDGTTVDGEVVTHDYAEDGTYTVSLTVTDDSGLSTTAMEEVSVSAPAEEISFLGASTVNTNANSFSVEVPDAVRPGDLLLLTASFNYLTDPQPSILPGWQLVESVTDNSIRTSVWWRIAQVGDEDRVEVLDNAGQFVKSDVALLAYAGTSATAPIHAADGIPETGNAAAHTTPTVDHALEEGLVLSLWADRTSSTTGWAAPAGHTVRHEGIGIFGGRISTLITDSPLSGLTAGGATATADSVTSNATMWSLVLAPIGVGEPFDAPPVAEASVDCTGLVCTFDGSTSVDVEGPIVGWEWDLGDGTTASGATVEHTYEEAGSYTVTLTVTDDADQTTSTAITAVAAEEEDALPVAEASVDCTDLDCAFDGSASSDVEGPIVAWDWDLGDGTTASGATVAHTYAEAGAYEVTLTVTDEEGQTDTVTTTATPGAGPASDVTFIGASTVSDNLTSFSVDVPAGVSAGDLLVLTASFNYVTDDPQPVALPGWQLIETVTDSALQTSVWWRIAEDGDAGRAEVLDNAGQFVKGDIALLAYTGTSRAAPIHVADGIGEPGLAAAHTTPTVDTALSAGVVLSLWADRTSSTDGWTAPTGHVTRHQGVVPGGGRVTSLLTESPLSGSTAGGNTATASSSASNATMWTIVLAPQGVEEPLDTPPTATATVSCAELVCTFDGSGSSDAEGPVADWAWDFGDGTTGSGATVQHTYAATGTYPATLTVTDAEGQTSTAAVAATASGPVEGVTFVGASAITDNRTSFDVDVPQGVAAGDVLLLTASFNWLTDPQPSVLPGWQLIEQVTDNSIRTSVWWRIAADGDAGQTEVLDNAGQFVKGDVALLAYTGTSTTAPIHAADGAPEPGLTPAHTTPVVPTSLDGGLVVSLWVDRTTSTVGWEVPFGHIARHKGLGVGGGRLTSLITESPSGVAGSSGGITATASSSANNATMWTLVLAPGA